MVYDRINVWLQSTLQPEETFSGNTDLRLTTTPVAHATGIEYSGSQLGKMKIIRNEGTDNRNDSEIRVFLHRNLTYISL